MKGWLEEWLPLVKTRKAKASDWNQYISVFVFPIQSASKCALFIFILSPPEWLKKNSKTLLTGTHILL